MPVSTNTCKSGDFVDETLFEQIACAIEERGYVVLPASLPETVADNLLDGLSRLSEQRFHRAKVGRGSDQVRNRFVRNDRIAWIEDDDDDLAAWLLWTRQLKDYLNRRLFLGLFGFESHFAHYLPGDFYKKHLDAFRGEANRVLSLVTYLNKGWEPHQGGELLMYSPEDERELFKVQPCFGTLVLFLSEEFPHEVLPAERDRYSVAGWFRLNTSLNNQIDPAR
ncbi:MAG: 2OG-Fe(II) oxygenase [Pseudomonadales bacterium]|nr:2OG-Fe(II) oxygenase [Pseudomonadales bacterium]